MNKPDVITMLVAVARAAYFLADDTQNEDGVLTVPEEGFDALSTALDALDELPEPGPNLYGTGPAKAEAFLALQVPVDSKALLQVLEALNGPDHHIRELQFTRGPLVGDNNPINKLVEEFNAWVTARNEAADDG